MKKQQTPKEQMMSELKKLIQSEDKSGAMYILKMLDHKTWFYRYEENHKKGELKSHLLELLNNDYTLFKAARPYRLVIEKYLNQK